MNIPHLKLSVSLLVLVTTGAALAEPGHGGGFFGFSGHFAGRDPARREEVLQRQQERRAERKEANGAERCNEARRAGERACANPESAPKRNRLSPEERRALRRQIQNAGQELYVPAK